MRRRPSRLDRRQAFAWLAGICTALLGCREGPGGTDKLLTAIGDLEDALCACPDSDADCGRESLIDDCRAEVIRDYEEPLDDWLACMATELRRDAACVRAAKCDPAARDACDVDLDDANDVCGEPPEGASEQVRHATGQRCLEPIDCDDGQVTEGNFCNGLAECSDRSDEAFCEGEDVGAVRAGGAGGSGGAFVCRDGVAIPAELLCDGNFDCGDGEDETVEQGCRSTMVTLPPTPTSTPMPTPGSFVCPDGSSLPGSAQCDGVPDCFDASDELGCVTPSASPSACLAAAQPVAGLPASCRPCACIAAPLEASQCDLTCWEMIACVGERCPGFAPGSADQTSCALNLCMAFLPGAMSAVALGPVLRERCAEACDLAPSPRDPGTPMVPPPPAPVP